MVLAAIPIAVLQAQLADGKKVDLKRIAEAYGLQENMPLHVKLLIWTSEDEDGRLQAELSATQIDKYRFWQLSLLDRLIVLGATLERLIRCLNGPDLTGTLLTLSGWVCLSIL